MSILLSTKSIALPSGFCYAKDPRFISAIHYASDYNFMGRPAAGYHQSVCILSIAANNALVAIQNELDALQKGYVLKLFDCYRPTTAVADFQQWSKDPKDIKTKKDYYPDFEKSTLFEQGYISSKSSHSRGSTVDLTITIRNPQNPLEDTELDMGTPFDFFDEKSNTDSANVSIEAQKNRQFLKKLMEKHGFKNYHLEWWHYTLENEPFPDTYFDFPVE